MPAQISARADQLVARLALMRGNVALFSHGHFSPVLAVRWIGLEIALGQHFQLGTASLSILSTNPSRPAIRVIALWNAAPDFLAGRS
jgi:probable phosphoglycerate mutase